MLFLSISRPQTTQWYRSKVFAQSDQAISDVRLDKGKGWHLFFCSEAPGLVFSEEKDGGLPPVTSEKAPALFFIKRLVSEFLSCACANIFKRFS
jgi:hypothetical protein